MDGLVFLVVIVGLVANMIAKMKKQQEETAKKRQRAPTAAYDPDETHAPSRYEEPQVRPADIDLPGQTSMPTWSGASGSLSQTRSIPDPPPELRPFYDNMTDAEWSTAQETRRQSDRASWDQDTQAHGPAAIPGLGLRFDSDALVRGVIYSEILTRRPLRRPR